MLTAVAHVQNGGRFTCRISRKKRSYPLANLFEVFNHWISRGINKFQYLKHQLAAENFALRELVNVLQDERDNQLEKAVVASFALFQHVQQPVQEILTLQKGLLKSVKGLEFSEKSIKI